jgi:hypothetical protein
MRFIPSHDALSPDRAAEGAVGSASRMQPLFQKYLLGAYLERQFGQEPSTYHIV